MQEFSATASEKIAALPANAQKTELREDAAQLTGLVEAHAPPDEVARQARSLATALVAAYPVPLAPSQPPDVDRGAALYQQMCTACHGVRSEEHTSELQSLMRISYAVFCLKKKQNYHSK